jgi:16S rRNA (guanine527-N7)-methyltransferase
MDGKALQEEAAKLGLHLSRAQLEAFGFFEAALYEANTAMNLTRVPKEECWVRHFLDSLLLSPLVPRGATVLDIGSGGGFPGVCLAIARADLVVSCMDSSGKSVQFLRTNFAPGGRLPFLMEVIEARAEVAAHDSRFREQFDFVTGRAVAPLPIQLELSAGFARVGGLVVPMRTPADREAARGRYEPLGLQLVELRTAVLPPLRATRLFPVYRKQGRTPPEFPRSWAKIRRDPIGGVSSTPPTCEA